MKAYLEQKKNFPFIPFIINIAIPLIFGASSRYFVRASTDNWSLNVNKPEYSPSSEAAVTILISLYFLIGISSFIIWKLRKTIKNYPGVICIYFTQLVLHFAWRITYFGQDDFFFSLYFIGAGLVVAILNMIVFYRINKLAGLLLVPYILWIIYSLNLTYSIYLLNL